MTLETDNVKPFPVGRIELVKPLAQTDLPMYQRVGALEGQVAILQRTVNDLLTLLADAPVTEMRKPGPPRLRRHPK